MHPIPNIEALAEAIWDGDDILAPNEARKAALFMRNYRCGPAAPPALPAMPASLIRTTSDERRAH